MAQLGKEYPFPERKEGEDWKEFYKAQDKAFEAIPKNKVISFSVADSYAYYYIKSFSPLVLQHINYCDGYYVPYAHIRGLRKQDVEQMIEWDKKRDELFKQQKEKQK